MREEHHFRCYIHLKTIPEAAEALLAEAGQYADRLSINTQMPLETSLTRLAPDKNLRAIRRTMGRLRLKLDEAKEANEEAGRPSSEHGRRALALQLFNHPARRLNGLLIQQAACQRFEGA